MSKEYIYPQATMDIDTNDKNFLYKIYKKKEYNLYKLYNKNILLPDVPYKEIQKERDKSI